MGSWVFPEIRGRYLLLSHLLRSTCQTTVFERFYLRFYHHFSKNSFTRDERIMPSLESAVRVVTLVVFSFLLFASSCHGSPISVFSENRLAKNQCAEGEYRKFQSCLLCTNCSAAGLATYSVCTKTQNTICAGCPTKGNVDSISIDSSKRRCPPLEDPHSILAIVTTLAKSTPRQTTDVDISIGEHEVRNEGTFWGILNLHIALFVMLIIVLLVTATLLYACKKRKEATVVLLTEASDDHMILSKEYLVKADDPINCSHEFENLGTNMPPQYTPQSKQLEYQLPSYNKTV